MGDLLTSIGKRGLVAGMVAAMVLTACPFSVRAQGADETAEIMIGDVYTTDVSGLKRVSVANPEIADITDANATSVGVIGKTVGQTGLFIWDSSGKKTVILRVYEDDLRSLKMRVRTLLESAGLMGLTVQENAQEGKVVVSGDLLDEKMPSLTKALEPVAEKTIVLVNSEKIQDLIQIDMQITELSTTLSKTLGVDWNQSIGISESNFPQTGEIEDVFKLGDFNRVDAIVATINTMITDGRARIISKPRLVVSDGKEANLLVGGEYPIRTSVTQDGNGNVTQEIEYKEYGVSLAITPTLRDGKIEISMNTEIRDIDSAQPTFGDAAFIVRSAQTHLLLDDRQTIVLAGLIKKRDNEQVSRVPILGKIPLVGILFRKVETPLANEDTEVVITLTPTVLKSKTQKKTAAPAAVTTAAVPRTVEMVPVAIPPERNREDLPVISENAVSRGFALPQAIGAYGLQVQQKIASAVAYPLAARENGWRGTVKVEMVIRNDGSLRGATVKESSGYDVFDQDAVNTAYMLAPYPSFPADLKGEQVSLVIPIVYGQD